MEPQVPKLVSDFAQDPDMVEIVEIFLDELPDRLNSISAAFASGDIETLGRLAHQIRGAGGGYGYPTISEAGGALEDCIREGRALSEVGELCDRLTSICQQALPNAA